MPRGMRTPEVVPSMGGIGESGPRRPVSLTGPSRPRHREAGQPQLDLMKFGARGTPCLKLCVNHALLAYTWRKMQRATVMVVLAAIAVAARPLYSYPPKPRTPRGPNRDFRSWGEVASIRPNPEEDSDIQPRPSTGGRKERAPLGRRFCRKSSSNGRFPEDNPRLNPGKV